MLEKIVDKKPTLFQNIEHSLNITPLKAVELA